MAYTHENVVVCGIDASAESHNALLWAAHEAQVRSARLDILCAYEEPTFAGHVGTSEGSIDLMLAEELLAGAKHSVENFGIEVTTQAVAEDPVEMFVQRSKKVARIVLGSRGDGKRRKSKRILGSVAAAVTAHSCCAVVVIPTNDVARVLPVRSIVCGIDGSEASRGALRLAIREASRWKAKLSCVNSVNFGGNSWLPNSLYQQNVLSDAEESMCKIVEECMQGLDVSVDCQVVEGTPAALLSEYSTTVDMLILGTRGRGGFAGLLLGSTSQAVLQNTSCPVTIVPARAADNENELEIQARWGDYLT